MTTATTNTPIDQTSDAAFRIWVAEVITALFTTIGLTQTADTGQINTTTVTRQVTANTAAGYVIGRFNDTAQSTSPIFFKLEFGTGTTATTSPAMWVTVGTGSNGSGTLTGVLSTRNSISSAIPASTSINYPSYFCYKATQGFLGMAYKTGSVNTNAFSTLIIARTTDASGAPTTNGYAVLTTNSTIPSQTGGILQVYNYGLAAFLTLTTLNGGTWCAAPFIATSTLVSGNISLGPCWQADPALGINASYGLVCAFELSTGLTIVAALVGTTTHTFVSVGAPYGGVFPGSQTNWVLLMLFE